MVILHRFLHIASTQNQGRVGDLKAAMAARALSWCFVRRFGWCFDVFCMSGPCYTGLIWPIFSTTSLFRQAGPISFFPVLSAWRMRAAAGIPCHASQVLETMLQEDPPVSTSETQPTAHTKARGRPV